MNLFDKVFLLRRGGGVLRFHTEPSFRKETVAEHSFGVALILCEIAPEGALRVPLLRAALYHDIAEQTTGDVPAPVKWANPDLSAWFEKRENRFRSQLGLDSVQLTRVEWDYLHMADTLDLCFTTLDRMVHGDLDSFGVARRIAANLDLQALMETCINAKGLYDEWCQIVSTILRNQEGILYRLSHISPWEPPATMGLPRVPGNGGTEGHGATKPGQPTEHRPSSQHEEPALPTDARADGAALWDAIGRRLPGGGTSDR